MAPKEILKKLLELQCAYAQTHRYAVTAERLRFENGNLDEIDVIAEKYREPLIEHVGHLPIIASFLHQYIQHREKIDLGRVMIMLSIHDIGETVTGDILTYRKVSGDNLDEEAAAKKLLPPELVSYYEEMDRQESWDAKFAKAVDSFAPDLHEITIPEISKRRYKKLGFNSVIIEKKKRKYFAWDEVLNGIFDVVIESHGKIERGEPTGF